VVLGDLEALAPTRRLVEVTVVLGHRQMPTDGDTQFVFAVDAKTLETVFVYRVLGG
jgi:hypothetical protein